MNPYAQIKDNPNASKKFKGKSVHRRPKEKERGGCRSRPAG